MGVKGLWKLIQHTGKPVPLETLENKVLAVDVSIWLHQVTKGFVDARGQVLPNAHLLGLFHRLCKLLFCRIRPVFVFDGGIPLLKQRTVASRRQRRAGAQEEAERVRRQLLRTRLKKSALDAVLGKGLPAPSDAGTSSPCAPPAPPPRIATDDLFYLPPVERRLSEEEDDDDNGSDSTENSVHRPSHSCAARFDLHTLDVRSAEFRALPADVRHDILSELKETRKQSSWGKLHHMPRESNNFSSYQMSRLLQRRSVQDALEKAEKEMGARTMSLVDLEQLMTDTGSLSSDVDPGRRIVADSSTRYIFLPSVQSLPSSNADKKTETKPRPVVEDNSLSTSEPDTSKAIDEFLVFSEDDDDYVDYGDEENRLYTTTKDHVPNTSLQTADSVFESSGLTQKQILAVIQSQNTSASKDRVHQQFFNLASTSKTDHSQSPKKISESLKSIESIVSSQNTHAGEKDFLDDNINSSIEKCSIERETKSNDTLSSERSDDEFVEVLEENTSLTKEKNDCSAPLQVVINTSLTELKEDIFADVFHDIPHSTVKHATEKLCITTINSEGKNNEDICKTISKESEIESQNTVKNDYKKVEILNKNNSNQSNLIHVPNSDILTLTDISKSSFLEAKVTTEKQDLKNEEIHKSLDMQANHQAGVKTSTSNFIIPSEILKNVSPEKVTGVENVITEYDTSLTDSSITSSSPKNEILELAEKPKENTTISAPVVSSEKIREIELLLQEERVSLEKVQHRQEVLAANITDQMVQEAQELLQLFGVPYIVAPMEAEAQCAFLDMVSLTDGTITDDSDIWLFGGQKVYKNFFNQKKHVMQFQDIKIHHSLKLSRQQMILLALLVGSDYTVGLPGVGPVTGLEILAAFPSVILNGTSEDLLKGLHDFCDWCKNGKVAAAGRADLRTKLKNVELNDDFPCTSVVNAYLAPAVDSSLEKFTWGKPDLESIKEFTRIKFGWSSSKTQEILGPIIKKLNIKNSQHSIDAYFKIIPKLGLPDDTLSKRVQKAVKRLGNSGTSDSDQSPEKKPKIIQPNKNKKNKKKQEEEKGNCSAINMPSTSSNSTMQCGKEFILQKEKDKLKLLNNKLRAIKVFRSSAKGKKKNNNRKRTQLKEAQLSESSSDE